MFTFFPFLVFFLVVSSDPSTTITIVSLLVASSLRKDPRLDEAASPFVTVRRLAAFSFSSELIINLLWYIALSVTFK